MPEIVELKIFAKSIKDMFFNHAAVTANNARHDFDLSEVAEGKYLTDVVAHGKELFFWFDGEPAFSAHLMINGGFAVLNENLRPAAADAVAEIKFDNGNYLMLFDPDGYAKVTPFKNLPDVPEATRISLNGFLDIMNRRKGAAVKSVLCDQKCIRGIGNAYADEILYDALIMPDCKCGKIPDDERVNLYESMINVLCDAIEKYSVKYKGVTCGEMRDYVKVHTPARYTKSGEIIKVMQVGGKKTYYVQSQRSFI